MKKHVLLLFLIAGSVIVFSCNKQALASVGKIEYPYIYNDDWTKPIDSIKLYAGVPFEKSLELYKDSDTLTKSVDFLIYLKLFKIKGQKFAVLADSAYTSCYKFMPSGQIKKEFTIAVELGTKAITKIRDLNGDGYNDVVYTMRSGGFYGDDNCLFFFDPKKKTLIYNEKPDLRNIEISGDTVSSYTKFHSERYVIRGFDLHLIESTEYLQGENDGKKVMRYYDAKASEIKRDTLTVVIED
jgi:hypothetical protein